MDLRSVFVLFEIEGGGADAGLNTRALDAAADVMAERVATHVDARSDPTMPDTARSMAARMRPWVRPPRLVPAIRAPWRERPA